MRRDRAQPVVTGQSAAAAGLQPTRLEVDLVVDHENRVRIELVEACGGSHRPAGLIHERVRLQERDAVIVHAKLGQLP